MNREITLMVYIKDDKDPLIQEIRDFCKENDIEISKTNFRYYSQHDRIFDFNIIGRTKEFKILKEKFRDRIIETYYAELGNQFDLDKDSFDKWQRVLLTYYEEVSGRKNKLHSDFYDLLEQIDTVEKARFLSRFPMDDFAKRLIEDKTAIIIGEKDSYWKWLQQETERDEMVSTLSAVQKGEYTLTENDIKGIKQFLMRDWSNKCV
jgi:hypothetical protein